MSEESAPYGNQPEAGHTILNDLADIHEQVKLFVERELEGACKVTSIYSTARTRYVQIPGGQLVPDALFIPRDRRMSFDVDVVDMKYYFAHQMNFQVDVVEVHDNQRSSRLLMVMKKRIDDNPNTQEE